MMSSSREVNKINKFMFTKLAVSMLPDRTERPRLRQRSALRTAL